MNKESLFPNMIPIRVPINKKGRIYDLKAYIPFHSNFVMHRLLKKEVLLDFLPSVCVSVCPTAFPCFFLCFIIVYPSNREKNPNCTHLFYRQYREVLFFLRTGYIFHLAQFHMKFYTTFSHSLLSYTQHYRSEEHTSELQSRGHL